MRSRLAVAGIDSHVRGTSAEMAFGLGGAPTISGLRVEIAEEMLDEAERILAEDERVRELAGDWLCGKCSEQNDATFEFCWNCTKERGPSDAKIPNIKPIAAPESLVRDHAAVNTSATLDASKKPNPYQPVLITDGDNAKPRLPSSVVAPDEHVESVLRKLYRLSCVSLMMLPTPLVLFSLYQVSSVPRSIKNHPIAPPRLRRLLIMNLIIAALMLLFWLAMLIA